ncbi:MAG TPA: hypothetical protein P5137_15840 [Candidatus Brocadiia bacterium]|nr:hypothetical protein [Candidatus Brocadiia bacterium]
MSQTPPPLARRIAAVAAAAAVLALGAWGLRAARTAGDASPHAAGLARLPLPPGARPIPGQSTPSAGLARYLVPGPAASVKDFYLNALPPLGWRQRSLPAEYAGEHTLAFSRRPQVCIITMAEDGDAARCVVTVFHRDIGANGDAVPWSLLDPGAGRSPQRTTGAKP